MGIRELLVVSVAFMLLTGIPVQSALAQGNSAALPNPALVADACKRDVLKYQANIELVRKTLGDDQANALAARFMRKPEWDALLLSEGYCGLAKRLREQRLVP